MILGIIINFSILFTFIIFAYFLLEHAQEKRAYIIEYRPIIVGLAATFISLILMKTSITFDDGLIGDNRNISILLAGLLGGPYALLIASVLVGLFRFILFDVTVASVTSGIMLIVIGVTFFLVSLKIKMTYSNIHYYLLAQTICVAATLIFLQSNFLISIKLSLLFIFSNIIGFYVTFFVLNLFKNQFERIRIIERLAETDYTTELPNLRKFDEIFNNAIKNEKNFSILLVNIDDFKNINRTYGHLSADEVLFEIAKIIKDFSNKNEIYAGRIAGDEFCLLCYEAAPAIGIHFASDLFLKIRNSKFVLSDQQEVNATVSIGVASFPDNGQSIREIVWNLDKAVSIARTKKPIQVIHVNQIK